MEVSQCSECGRELSLLGGGAAPERCEDCRPETGEGSLFAEQLGRNLRRLRTRAGIERKELERRAGLRSGEVAKAEGDRAREIRTTTLLRLCHSLGASIDEVTERIYWNPAEIAPSGNGEAVRLAGFFLVVRSEGSSRTWTSLLSAWEVAAESGGEIEILISVSRWTDSPILLAPCQWDAVCPTEQ